MKSFARTIYPALYPAITVGLLLAAAIAPAAVQTKVQRDCITALDRAGAKLAKAAGKDFLRCLKDASAGKLAPGQTAEQCLTADRDGFIARAQLKVNEAEARRCTVPPAFGAKTAADVNAAFAPTLRVHEVFGPDLDAAVIASSTDAAGATCQRTVARGMVKIANARLKAFNSASASGLRDGSIASGPGLRACLEADRGGRVAAAVAKAQLAASAHCAQTAIASAFPGTCAGEPLATLFACIAPRAECDACLAIDAAGHVGKGCHRYADGVATFYCGDRPVTDQSVARQWDEEILGAIRLDTPRPTVHARNLFHLAAGMWDAWRVYGGSVGSAFLSDEAEASADPEADRAIAISFAAYRILAHRYALSVNAALSQVAFQARMAALGFDPSHTSTAGDVPAAVGNRIAAALIAHGQGDGANEAGDYADPTYVPVNEPLVVALPGTTMTDPNRWQPLVLDLIVTQNGITLPEKIQVAIGARWNDVTPFALTRSDPEDVYIDPGPPPRLGTASDADYKQAAVGVIQRSSELTPDDGATIDISPGAYGNNPLGTNDGTGHPVNPVTNLPYASQVVKRGDLGRVLAEFWADGPSSETPPGHWNVLANYVSDHPLLGPKRIGGTGPVLGNLEWDVKLYFALNGAVHDAAVVAWGLKRKYDSVRPISMVRYMGGLGQSSDIGGPSYDPDGLPLVPGLIEVITAATTAPGERHQTLFGHEGEIAILAWPATPGDTYAGARWIRAVEWRPYQKSSFVTPAFPGYTSGHSTFSRAAAEVLTSFTGNAYFPGGLGEFVAPANTYLTFELGPTTDVALQWATYYDAADQAGQSRIYGGIHIEADDFNGRITGSQVGLAAYARAQQYFSGTLGP